MLRQGTETLSEIFGASGVAKSPRIGDMFAPSGRNSSREHKTFRSNTEDRLALPFAIVPDSGDVEDFYATVATYFSEKAPISAFCYVLDAEAERVFRRRDESRLEFSASKKSFSLRRACIGAALGEAALATLSAGEGVGGSQSYSVCRRTLAFSLCRGALLYGDQLPILELVRRWTRARSIGGLPAPAVVADVVLTAFCAAFDRPYEEVAGSSFDEELFRSLRIWLRDRSELRKETPLFGLALRYPGLEKLIEEMRGPFDSRMAAFSRFAETVRAYSRGTRADEVAIAAVCNEILPGSFSHVGVLAKLVESFPGALVWYGLFSALSGDGSEREAGDALVMKIDRDLVNPFSFDLRPTCDIDLRELEVLSRIALKPEMIKPSQSRLLLVSLLPGVDVYTRFGAESESYVDRNKTDAYLEGLHRHVYRLREEAQSALKSAGSSGRDSIGAPSRKRREK